MAKYIILGVVILNLALVSPCSAIQAVVVGGAGQNAGHSSPVLSVQREVLNIVVAKIEDGTIYSKDGWKFDISGAKVIDNSHPGTKMRTAELVFRSGSLAEVILK